MNTSENKLPVIDLNKISDEQELLPIIRSILLRNDTFLVKNFAYKETVDDLLNVLSQEIPDLQQGFDSNFTGTLKLPDYNENIYVEQYIFNTDSNLQFNRECNNITLRKLYNRIFKISLFLANICLKSIGSEYETLLSEELYGSKLTRYFLDSEYNRKQNEEDRIDLSDVLPYDISVDSMFSQNYEIFNSSGLITVFPIASNIMYKPQTVSISDNENWVKVDVPDSILFHCGELLAKLSGNVYTTSPLKINYNFNKLVHLTIYPPLNTKININGKDSFVNNVLFENQIEEFPVVAEKFYKDKLILNNLIEKVNYYKRLFTTTEIVLSLHLMSKISGVSPELHSLLPQMTNMMASKVTEESFLRMVSLWPACYIISANSRQELTVSIPKINPLATLTNKSRRLSYVEHADNWLDSVKNSTSIPSNVPIFKINKRRSSESNPERQKTPTLSENRIDSDSNLLKNNSTNPQAKYLVNTREELEFKEKAVTSQADLLQKLREKSKRSEALLEQKQRQYEQFVAVKMKQIFRIISTLPWNKPYTITNLTSLVVDSLQDSNNPIGLNEAEEILIKLQGLIPDIMIIHSVDGGLKVFKWSYLDKNVIQKRLQEYKDRLIDVDMN